MATAAVAATSATSRKSANTDRWVCFSQQCPGMERRTSSRVNGGGWACGDGSGRSAGGAGAPTAAILIRPGDDRRAGRAWSRSWRRKRSSPRRADRPRTSAAVSRPEWAAGTATNWGNIPNKLVRSVLSTPRLGVAPTRVETRRSPPSLHEASQGPSGSGARRTRCRSNQERTAVGSAGAIPILSLVSHSLGESVGARDIRAAAAVECDVVPGASTLDGERNAAGWRDALDGGLRPVLPAFVAALGRCSHTPLLVAAIRVRQVRRRALAARAGAVQRRRRGAAGRLVVAVSRPRLVGAAAPRPVGQPGAGVCQLATVRLPGGGVRCGRRIAVTETVARRRSASHTTPDRAQSPRRLLSGARPDHLADTVKGVHLHATQAERGRLTQRHLFGQRLVLQRVQLLPGGASSRRQGVQVRVQQLPPQLGSGLPRLRRRRAHDSVGVPCSEFFDHSGHVG
eukprot:ctg_812.g334